MDGTGVVEACSEMHGAVLGGERFCEPNAGFWSSPQVDRGRGVRGRSGRDGFEAFEKSFCLDVLFFAGLVGLCFATSFEDREILSEFSEGLGAVGECSGKVLEVVELDCDERRGVEHGRSPGVRTRGTGRVFFLAFVAPRKRGRGIFAEDDRDFLDFRLSWIDGVHEFLELNDFVLVALASSFGVVAVHVVFVIGQVAGGGVGVVSSAFKRDDLHGADSCEDVVLLLSLEVALTKEAERSGGRWSRN